MAIVYFIAVAIARLRIARDERQAYFADRGAYAIRATAQPHYEWWSSVGDWLTPLALIACVSLVGFSVQRALEVRHRRTP